MTPIVLEENQTRRYLLGELDAAEEILVEDAAFADADALAFVQSIENDLIDEYARGELAAAERGNFERKFLTSEERRRRIEYARTFLRLEEKNAAVNRAEIAAPESARKSFWQTLFGFSLKPQMAFAALALLVLCGGALLFFNLRGRENEIAEQKNANVLPPSPAANQSTNDSIVAPTVAPIAAPPIENSRAPDKSNQNNSPNVSPPAPKASPTPPTKIEAPAPTFAALVFPAGMTRDGGGGGKTLQLKLAANVKTARLVFNLENGDEFKNYQIEIKSKSGAGVSPASVSRSGRAVVVNVPAAKLAAGNYEAVLRGIDRDRTETIGYYDFVIVKP